MAFTPVRERGALGKLGHILQMSDPRYGALYAEQAQDYERQQGLAALAQQYPELAPLAQLGDPGLVGKAYMAKTGMGGFEGLGCADRGDEGERGGNSKILQ
jgi:hypothetical protein